MTVDLHVDIAGDGPDVVLVHGTPSSPSHFAALAERLSERFRVLVPHLPGYGETPPLAPGFTLQQRDDAVLQALLDRGVEQAHLLGYSCGTLVALKLALSGRISPLSLFALAGMCELDGEEREAFRQFAQAIRSGQDAAPIAGQRFLSPEYAAQHPDAVREVENWVRGAKSLDGELSVLADELSDLTPALAALRCPVVARTGSLDLAVPVGHAETLVAAVPDGTLQVVDGAGHALLLEDFEATADAIEAAFAD